MDIEKAVEQIKKLITESNQSTSINALLENSSKIAGYLMYLSEIENKAYRDYLDAYNHRKVEFARYIAGKEGAVNKLENEALIKTKELKEMEIGFDALYNKLKGVRQTTSQFLDVLRQKISYMKTEKEHTKSQV